MTPLVQVVCCRVYSVVPFEGIGRCGICKKVPHAPDSLEEHKMVEHYLEVAQ